MSNIESFSFPPTRNNSSFLSRSIKFGQFLQSSHEHNHNDESSYSDEDRSSSSSSTSTSRRPSHEDNNHGGQGFNSPYNNNNYSLTPSPYWISQSSNSSPYTKSPWLKLSPILHTNNSNHNFRLIGSLVREEGHVYSLATSSHFLYTGSDSRNIRVWTKSGLQDSGGFKSSSGLVKSIIVGPNNKIFTGHQDGKIRIWHTPNHPKPSSSSSSHNRVGSLPRWRDYLRSWVNPTKRNKGRHGRKGSVTCQHFDAVSSMSVDMEAGLLYSASWDKTVKIWRLKDSKCVDTIKPAHNDAVNAVVAAGFGDLIFSGSADGTVKVWRREIDGKTIRHVYVETIMEQTSAVTSLAVMMTSSSTGTGTLYAGSSDGLVSFWEWEKTTTGGVMNYGGVLRGHKQAVLCLATAGSMILSGSADNTVCVWKREDIGVSGGDHVCQAVLTGHTGPVKCLAVDNNTDDNEEEEEEEDRHRRHDSSDIGVFANRRWIVYSGSLDNSVKVWTLHETENHIKRATR